MTISLMFRAPRRRRGSSCADGCQLPRRRAPRLVRQYARQRVRGLETKAQPAIGSPGQVARDRALRHRHPVLSAETGALSSLRRYRQSRHGSFQAGPCGGGQGRLAALAKQTRGNCPAALCAVSGKQTETMRLTARLTGRTSRFHGGWPSAVGDRAQSWSRKND